MAEMPGLGVLNAFNNARQQSQSESTGQLQQIHTLQQVFGAQQKQQEMGRIRQIIQQGGAPEQVVQALVGVGETGALMAKHYTEALKAQQEAAIRQKMTGGVFDMKNPDQLDALGALGLDGTRHFPAMAERIRKAAADRQALAGMQGMDTPVTRSVLPAGGSQDATDAALMAAYQKQGGGSVTAVPAGGEMAVDETRYAPTTKQGGAFSSLMASSIPAIAQQAAELQRRVDAGQITAAQADVLHGRLVQQQASAEIAQAKPVAAGNGEPLQAIIGPDGKPKLVRRSDAVGATPYSPSIAGGSEGMLSPEALRLTAEQYLAGDRQAVQGYARSASTRAALQNEITRLAQEKGMGGREIAAEMANFAGIMSGSRTVGTRAAQIELASSEALKMIDIVKEQSAKFDRSSFIPWNAALKAYDTNTGAPEVKAYGAAINSLVNVYARAINPSGVATVSDKEHAREIMRVVDSPEQVDAVLKVLVQEMEAARAAPAEVRAATRAALTETRTPPAGAIEMLKKFPNQRANFDKKYGAGAAAKVLGN